VLATQPVYLNTTVNKQEEGNIMDFSGALGQSLRRHPILWLISLVVFTWQIAWPQFVIAQQINSVFLLLMIALMIFIYLFGVVILFSLYVLIFRPRVKTKPSVSRTRQPLRVSELPKNDESAVKPDPPDFSDITSALATLDGAVSSNYAIQDVPSALNYLESSLRNHFDNVYVGKVQASLFLDEHLEIHAGNGSGTLTISNQNFEVNGGSAYNAEDLFRSLGLSKEDIEKAR
jgi:hypothetical protein